MSEIDFESQARELVAILGDNARATTLAGYIAAALRAGHEDALRSAKAEIIKLEHVLRETRAHAWNAGCRGYLGTEFFVRIDGVLAAHDHEKTP